MASPTLRISEESHLILQTLSEQFNRSMQEIAAEAIEEYRKKVLFEAAARAYAALRADQELWEEEQQERALWESADLDGLSDETWASDGGLTNG